AEGVGERLGTCEVGFLEFQPRDVLHLDHRILRPPGVLTFAGTLLAVQVAMGVNDVVHAPSFLTDEIVTCDATVSQEFLTKSSKVNLSVIVSGVSKQDQGPVNRLERRKQRTRAALIQAAQGLIAAGKLNVPVLEITQAADV